MFEILHVEVPTKNPTPEELLATHYGRSSILIKADDGNYYVIVDGTFTVPDTMVLEWEKIGPDYFGDNTIEDAINSMNMENITDRVTIKDAVEVWCDNECGPND